MTCAQFKIMMDEERAATKGQTFGPPPPMPAMTPEQKERARESLRDRQMLDAARYAPYLRQHAKAGVEGDGSGDDDSAREARRLEIRAILASAIAAAREEYPGLPIRSATEEEARENPNSPGWYDPVNHESVVNDAAAEKIAPVISDEDVRKP